MCQRRPADPTDPGDAADLSIMGYSLNSSGIHLASEQSSQWHGQLRKSIGKSTLS